MIDERDKSRAQASFNEIIAGIESKSFAQMERPSTLKGHAKENGTASASSKSASEWPHGRRAAWITKKRLWPCVLGLTTIVAVYIAWRSTQALTPLERQLAGRWYRLIKGTPSGDVLVVFDYQEDRRASGVLYRQRHDAFEVLGKGPAHWHVEADVLVYDNEACHPKGLSDACHQYCASRSSIISLDDPRGRWSGSKFWRTTITNCKSVTGERLSSSSDTGTNFGSRPRPSSPSCAANRRSCWALRQASRHPIRLPALAIRFGDTP